MGILMTKRASTRRETFFANTEMRRPTVLSFLSCSGDGNWA